LVQYPEPFSRPISALGVFALRALLSGLYCERSFINIEIRYDIDYELALAENNLCNPFTFASECVKVNVG